MAEVLQHWRHTAQVLKVSVCVGGGGAEVLQHWRHTAQVLKVSVSVCVCVWGGRRSCISGSIQPRSSMGVCVCGGAVGVMQLWWYRGP